MPKFFYYELFWKPQVMELSMGITVLLVSWDFTFRALGANLRKMLILAAKN